MTNSKIKLSLCISAAVMLVDGATTMIRSNDAVDDNLSPGQIFQQARQNYASLTSYSDEGQIVANMNNTTIITTFTTLLARTNFYKIEWKQAVESTYSTNNTEVQRVWSSGAGNFLDMGNGSQNEEGREFALAKANEISGGVAGAIPRTFFNMQRGNQLNDSGLNETRQMDEKVGNIDCYVFTRESNDRTRTLWIGKQDYLIHQIRIVMSAEAIQTMLTDLKVGPELITSVEQSVPHGYTSTETHTGIAVNRCYLRSDFIPSNGE